VPSSVVLDTSFVVHALDTDERHHRAAQSWLGRAGDAGTLLVFNRLLELELLDAAYKLPLRRRFGGRWQARRHDGRSLRRSRRLAEQTMELWRLLLDSFDHLLVEVDEVAGRVEPMMSDYGLASYDAVHAATAELYGTEAVVTADTDFARVPESVFTVLIDSAHVAQCRQVRAAGR
jgi:predicted nucleic acid-binding protein